jgi:uncharacterized damage-inducible protein DinB
MSDTPLEYWMRGPVPDIAPMLQPVAHALLQARDEVNAMMQGFPQEKLWEKPGGMASVGFHLQHLRGVVDRLFTYARGEKLTETQLEELRAEGQPAHVRVEALLEALDAQVEKAFAQLKATSQDELLQMRGIGRKQIPTNVLGLLFHAAEHTMRHTGQLMVTARIQS